MPRGYPDGTKAVVIDVRIEPQQNYLGSLAETKEKKTATERTTVSGDLCPIVPPSGEKVGLIMAVASSQYIEDTFEIQIFKNGVWSTAIEPIHGGFFLAFPCWEPDMDVGDGTNARVRFVTTGTGPWTGFFIYYVR